MEMGMGFGLVLRHGVGICPGCDGELKPGMRVCPCGVVVPKGKWHVHPYIRRLQGRRREDGVWVFPTRVAEGAFSA